MLTLKYYLRNIWFCTGTQINRGVCGLLLVYFANWVMFGQITDHWLEGNTSILSVTQVLFIQCKSRYLDGIVRKI